MNFKKRKASFIFLISIFLISIFSFFAFSNIANAKKIDKNYTYLLKDNMKKNEIEKLLKKSDLKANATLIKEINLLNIKIPEKEINKNKIKKFENMIKHHIEVKGSMPKVTVENKQTVNILNYNLTKKLTLKSNYFKPYNNYLSETTNNYKSYNYSKGKGTKIALIDTGVDIKHPNLRKNIQLNNAKSYVTKDTKNVTDKSGHGTGVAGIIQILAPEAKIIPYKVVNDSDGESLWIIEAIIDAVNDKNDIINLSLGTYLTQSENDKVLSQSYEKAINYAVKKKVIIVASAGNDGIKLEDYEKYGYKHFPGGNKNVITVSSNTNNNELAPYSNYGEGIDFSATGGSSYNTSYIDTPEDLIVTTSPIEKEQSINDQLKKIPKGYTLTEGTSFSTPQISAAIALIISQKKENRISVKNIVFLLKKGSIDIGEKGKDIYFGNGKINIYNLLNKHKGGI